MYITCKNHVFIPKSLQDLKYDRFSSVWGNNWKQTLAKEGN